MNFFKKEKKLNMFHFHMTYQIWMDNFSHIMHVNVHVHQLLQIEINFSWWKAKYSVADIRLNTSLFRIEEIRDGIGHVKQF